MNRRKIFWSGNKLELIELCYALYTCKLLEDYNQHHLKFKTICEVVFDLLGERLPHNPYESVCYMRRRKKKESLSMLYKSFKKCFDC